MGHEHGRGFTNRKSIWQYCRQRPGNDDTVDVGKHRGAIDKGQLFTGRNWDKWRELFHQCVVNFGGCEAPDTLHSGDVIPDTPASFICVLRNKVISFKTYL